MCRRCGLGILPLLLAVFSSATFVITYVISKVRNDTSWFPTISDTADHTPESNVFGLLFNFCAVLGLITACVRYLQLRHDADWNERDRNAIIRLNKVALLFGIVSSLGASTVANFQVSNIKHDLGREESRKCFFWLMRMTLLQQRPHYNNGKINASCD